MWWWAVTMTQPKTLEMEEWRKHWLSAAVDLPWQKPVYSRTKNTPNLLIQYYIDDSNWVKIMQNSYKGSLYYTWVGNCKLTFIQSLTILRYWLIFSFYIHLLWFIMHYPNRNLNWTSYLKYAVKSWNIADIRIITFAET